MKLNHRILLLIAPVILLSAAASSYIIYASQKNALLKRTDSYLQLNIEKLASHYRQAQALVSSYAFTLAKSDIIRHYFSLEKNPYRELELVDNLRETLHILQPSEKQLVSLSILNGNEELLYYAENSADPFAELDPKVMAYVKQRFASTQSTSDISYTVNSAGEDILVRYDMLDRQTLSTPLSYNRQDVFFVVVYVVLEQFNQLRKKIEFDNQSPIFFTHSPPRYKTGLTQSIELQPGFYAILDPAPKLINEKLHSIQRELLLSFGVSALVTVLLLLLLLYRHVINPILNLDKQLAEVESNKRKNIEKLHTDDEIGRLSSRFYAMYTELHSTYQRTKALAENDHLTKLANRYQFQVQADLLLSRCYDTQHIWVLYIDLDNFKYVNDKYGHQIGDSLLVSFATHIRQLCKNFEASHNAYSIAARLSGDEFAILLVAPKRLHDCANIFAQRVLDPIQSQDNSPLSRFPITASIGIATFPKDGDHIEKLLLNADTAMYQAKNAGKNQIAYYSQALDQIVQRRNNIERALRLGLFDQEFHLVYQPYFTCSGKRLEGFEVLLRWQSDLLGDISPDEFIPIAEQTGLFGTIDRWVVSQAFREFSDLQAMFNEPIQVSINLSSAELNSLKLAQFIHQQARTYQVPPQWIDFEITETFAADSQSFPLLHELSRLGYGLTIDDFGSGYTSITQLVQYPVQKIKFDRQFLDTLIATNKQNVIRPLIDLCHSQSMKVTAEGIESETMHQWLADYRCDYMQGFYFGHPMSLEEIHQWLHSPNQKKKSYAQDHYCFTELSQSECR
ncbi:biofilm architecture maintenance protein MbaA [Vibrio metoecus]|uniref:biofilm architecture maintenance protein MbaA n=1 Tax=Vibrio metoecus TaxID=1481663 RepID=UPI000BA97647|nr:biofilm architecture maintenance protein MbaA [Vibrio metoecus]PAR34112.1 diguanylate phosphodiesterase [Vibrio metoecus]PAR42773.1 diguanylate phosphodiesterase [Vibrio metoecus]